MIVHLEDAGTLPTRPLFKYPIMLEPMEPVELYKDGKKECKAEMEEVLCIRINVKNRSKKRTFIYLGNELIYTHYKRLTNEELWITIERLFEEKYNAKVKRIIP